MKGSAGIILFVAVFFFSMSVRGQKIYEVANGSVNFHSDAPQELIKASSGKLRGVFDVNKKTFVFKIDIGSFMGFNSPLQKEHFNENYMETDLFPQAIYAGKVIEDMDVTKEGEYNVRAKGKLNIHGVQQERIINSHIITRNGKITITSSFIVPLFEHSIKVPRLVYDKLAQEINVSVNAVLVPKS